MSKLEFTVPDENSPGYLRRMMTISKFQQLITDGEIMEYYDALIDFLLGFITVPKDKAEAREALLDASQKQYGELLTAAYGRANPTPPEVSEMS